MIIEYDFDLINNKNDRLWFAKIVADRYLGLSMDVAMEEFALMVNRFVHQFGSIDNIESDTMLAKRVLVDNVRIFFQRIIRLKYNSADYMHTHSKFGDNSKDWLCDQLFLQAQHFAIKWTQFGSESKKICKLLLSVNNTCQWKCYNCNLTNIDNNINECPHCNKGINPLWPARHNKSQTFCVNKQFGLIKWNSRVCFHSVCLFVCFMTI